VAYSDAAGEIAQVLLIEDLGHKTHAGAQVDATPVGGGYAGTLLAPVL